MSKYLTDGERWSFKTQIKPMDQVIQRFWIVQFQEMPGMEHLKGNRFQWALTYTKSLRLCLMERRNRLAARLLFFAKSIEYKWINEI